MLFVLLVIGMKETVEICWVF